MTIKTIESISLNPENNHQYIITMTDKINYGETPLLDYTKGDIHSSENKPLQNIVDYLIANNTSNPIPVLLSATTNTAGTQIILTFDMEMGSVTGKQGEFGVSIEVLGLYQKWSSGKPDTPELTSVYPNQYIQLTSGGTYVLVISSGKMYVSPTNNAYIYCEGNIKYYQLNTGTNTWTLLGSYSNTMVTTKDGLQQANVNVYTDSSQSTVFFTKTATTTITITQLNLASCALDSDSHKVLLNIRVADTYQKWSVYPDTPVLTSTYPYQCTLTNPTYYNYLYVSANKFYLYNGGLRSTSQTTVYRKTPSEQTWTLYTTVNANTDIVAWTNALWSDKEANYPIYTDSSYVTTAFAKTTPSTSTPISNGQTVKTAYTKGTVASSQGGLLESYNDVSVNNAVPSIYPIFNGYAQSPFSVIDFPYQALIRISSSDRIYASKSPLYTKGGTSYLASTIAGARQTAVYNGTSWSIDGWVYSANEEMPFGSIMQSNHNVFTTSAFTTVYFAKTTP